MATLTHADMLEEIDLIAEIGDADDALDLMRRLVRDRRTSAAIQVRRTVTAGHLDRDALREVAVNLDAARRAAQAKANREFRAIVREVAASADDNLLTRGILQAAAARRA